MTVTLVQSKVATGATASVTFDDAPAEGNLLLVAILSDAAIDDASAPTGWTFLSDASETGGVTGYGWLIGAERVAGAAESATADFSAAAPGNARLVAMEWHTTLAGWVNGGADTGDGGINGEAGATETERSAVGTGNLLVLAAACNGTTGWTPDGSSTELDEGQLAGPTPPDMSVTYQIADPVSAMTVTTTPGDPEQMASRVWTYLEMAPSGIYADWDGDGFGEPTSDDDLTGDTASWVITRGASAEITGGAQPGTATILLNNPADDRYNPLNAAGPLYGLLTDGVPFWIGVNSDGLLSGTDPRGLFGGRIKDITPLPVAGATYAPQVEITCEDALSWYDRTPAQLEDGIGRSQGAIRAAILADIGETRVDLPSEITTVPLSGWNGSALSALEELNAGNGSRHFIRPSDTRDTWYDYVCRNRQWRLDATADASVDAGVDHLTGTSGWRLSADTVINQQRATVTPISFTSGQVTVWEPPNGLLPLYVDTNTRWFRVEFDDYVDSPVVDYNYTGTAPTVTLYAYGTMAKLKVEGNGPCNIRALSIEGRMARRGISESVVVDDAASQSGSRGVRAGSDIGSQFIGVLASASGLAAHVVWRYATPQYRPTITVENWMPYQFEIDLFDIISVTIAELGMTDRLFEIVGLTHYGNLAASADAVHHVTDYVLQECRVQTDPGWFILDTSVLDGTDILVY